MTAAAPRRARPAGPVLTGALACLTTRAVRALLDVRFPVGDPRWTRTNHRGEAVTLLAGPATAAGLLAGAVLSGAGGASPRSAAAGVVAASGAAVLGVVDDLSEDPGTRRKGLRGHLGALVRGQVTTGGLKVVGIGATSLVAAAIATPRPGPAGAGGRTEGGGLARAVDVVASGALVAGTANLVNLLDLRPGRALKAGVTMTAPLLATPGGALAGACLGAAVAALPADLGERDMLGDGGANALGALAGTAMVVGAPRPVRLSLLVVVTALTLVSERISFTEVIQRTPVLRQIDGWGRRA